MKPIIRLFDMSAKIFFSIIIFIAFANNIYAQDTRITNTKTTRDNTSVKPYVIPQNVNEQGIRNSVSSTQVDNLKKLVGPCEKLYNSIKSIYPEAIEIIEKRGLVTKHFRNGDGTFTCAVGDNYHYLDNGEWKDINLCIQQSFKDKHYNYKCETNLFKSYFPTESGNKGFRMIDKGIELNMWNTPSMAVISVGGEIISKIHASSVNGYSEGNIIHYKNVYPDVDDEITVMTDAIKHNIKLNYLPSGLQANRNIIFTGITKLPNGVHVLINESVAPDNFTTESFSIALTDNIEGGPFYYNQVLVFDNTLDQSEAEFLAYAPEEKLTAEQIGKKKHLIFGEYKVQKEGNELYISVVVPGEWLTAQNTEYPVIIDPSVIIGTGTSLYRHPWDIYYNYARSQSIYLNSELNFDGTITNIYYDRDAIATAYSILNAQEWMDDVSASTLSSWQTEGTSVLGPSTWNIETAAGWYGFTLTTTFPHDNTYHLQVSFRHQDGSWSSPYHKFNCTSTSANYRTLEGANDGTNPPTVSQTYYRPNIYLVYTAPADPCAEAINIPSAPVTNQSLVCTGTALPGNLNATNVPTACGGASNSYKGGQEALYTFTPTTTGLYTISYSGQTWSAIFVYSGSCPASGGTCVGSVGSSASTQSLDVNLTASTLYYIWFDTWPSPNSPCAGTFSIVPPAPSGPACGDTDKGTITPACNQQDAAYTSGTIPYWKFNATSGRTYHFSLCSNSEDSYLRIYNSSFAQVASQDDNGPFCSGVSASISWNCASSGDYYITASNYSCDPFTNSGSMQYWYTTSPLTDKGTITPTASWQNAAYTSGTIPFWDFNATSGTSYDFSFCSNSEDSYLRIYNSSWTQTASNDDNGDHCSGSPASITWNCTSSSTYYIVGSNYSCDGFTNSDNMAYRITPPPCSPPTSVTAYADGGSSATVCQGASFNLTKNSDSGDGVCSGTWQYAWYNGSNYWNGSFSSGSAVYDNAYSTISTSVTSATTFTLYMRCSECTGSTVNDGVNVSVYTESTAPTSIDVDINP